MNKYTKKYRNIIVDVGNNKDDIDYVVGYFYNIIKVKNFTTESDYKQTVYNNQVNSYIRFNNSNNQINYGRLRSLQSVIYRNTYEKVFTINDVKSGLIGNLIKFGFGAPSYKPKKIKRVI